MGTATASMAACAAATVPLLPGSVAPLLVLGVLLGMSTGMTSVYDVAMASIFGRKHLGSINGYRISLLNVGAAVGPLVVAFGHDSVGFAPLFFALAALLAGMTCVVCSVQVPVAPKCGPSAASMEQETGEAPAAAGGRGPYGACTRD